MTKLTEEILRAQTCPFKIISMDRWLSDLNVIHIGLDKVMVRRELDKIECLYNLPLVLDNYKLPEPEPKLVTMYECVDWSGYVVFMNKDFQPIDLTCQVFANIDVYAARIPNGRTMQLDISGEQWKWVTE